MYFQLRKKKNLGSSLSPLIFQDYLFLINSNNLIVGFSIKEKKKGNLKEKKYVGTRIALVKPNIVTLRNGKEIIYRYMNVVTSYNKYFEKN